MKTIKNTVSAWIFGKPGQLRSTRHIDLSKNTVTIHYSQDGYREATRVERFKNTAAAETFLNRVMQEMRNGGFEEYENPDGALLGKVSHITKDGKSGRLRVDLIGDVFFDASSLKDAAKLKQSQRVFVYGIQKVKKPKVPFMFDSCYTATRVTPLPKGKKHKPLELAPAVRKAIIKAAGRGIMGNKTPKESFHTYTVGEFIFAFEKGLHRIVEIKNYPNTGKFICVEAVFDSKLNRTHELIQGMVNDFASPVPTEVTKILKNLALTV